MSEGLVLLSPSVPAIIGMFILLLEAIEKKLGVGEFKIRLDAKGYYHE